MDYLLLIMAVGACLVLRTSLRMRDAQLRLRSVDVILLVGLDESENFDRRERMQ